MPLIWAQKTNPPLADCQWHHNESKSALTQHWETVADTGAGACSGDKSSGSPGDRWGFVIRQYGTRGIAPAARPVGRVSEPGMSCLLGEHGNLFQRYLLKTFE